MKQNGQLSIVLARPLAAGAATELNIRYGGSPAKGLWFVRERDGMATQVFTQGECEDYLDWTQCVHFAQSVPGGLFQDYVPENDVPVPHG